MRSSWLLILVLVVTAGCAFDEGGLPGSDPTDDDPIVPLRDPIDAGMIIDPPLLEPDAAPPTAPNAPDAAPGPGGYGARCHDDAECDSMMCVDFQGPKGERCTRPCTTDADCPSGDRCRQHDGDLVCEP